ncbi:hypothetical protein ACE193_09970 [Bernardetia sp. OM2101]|uniref:hypothetical protein n=1 Tax=Bernardetia sp. OM2101 TaxID=3344876 RepID=UPI0035CEADF3
MKKIIVLFCVLFVCFGFSEKEKIENLRIVENCCDYEPIGCITLKKLAPGYTLYQNKKQRITEGKFSFLVDIHVEKDSDYMLRYFFLNSNGNLEQTGGLFLLNQENDTLARTFLNGKHYEGFTYKSTKNETLRVYIDPQENPLLLQKHKKKDKCAKIRCIEYAIGTRMVVKED